MRSPSRALRNAVLAATGESNFLAGAKRDVELANDVKKGMETIFGAALYSALEDLERSAYAKMSGTSPWNISKQLEARSELGVAQYIKSKLASYVTNSEALLANIESLGGWEESTGENID